MMITDDYKATRELQVDHHNDNDADDDDNNNNNDDEIMAKVHRAVQIVQSI